MKALSVKQPWAAAIVDGFKRVENRTWETKYRGRLVIHAGRSRVAYYLRESSKRLALAGYDPAICELDFGAAIGEVELVDCVRIEDAPEHLRNDPLAEGPWCWILADAVRYKRPVSMVGRLGLFEASVKTL